MYDLNTAKMKIFYNGKWYDKLPKEVVTDIKTNLPEQWAKIDKKYKIEKPKK